MYETIILAGGYGTRLRGLLGNIPKCLAPVQGKPFITYLLDYLERQQVGRVVLSVGYLHNQIIEQLGNQYRTISIDYSVEDHPLGTGGAVRKAITQCSHDHVFVLNGDSIIVLDFSAMVAFHTRLRSSVTIALRHVADVSRYGSVETDSSGRIVTFGEKPQANCQGLINAGVYLLNRQDFMQHPFPFQFSIEKDFFSTHYHKIAMYGFVTHGYFIDIGIPEDYESAQHELSAFFG